MDLLSCVLIAFAPGLFWMWFIGRKDDLDPEPRWLLAKVFTLGMLAAGLILRARPRIEHLFMVHSPFSEAFTDAFLVTALCEEVVKAGALCLGASLYRHFDEPLDGIIYGAAAALGFATLENFVHLQITGDSHLVAQRAFTATLAHVAFTGGFGFFLGKARFVWPRWSGCLVAVGLAVAVGLHGLYDFLLAQSRAWGVLGLMVVLPGALLVLSLKIRWMRRHSPCFTLRRMMAEQQARQQVAPQPSQQAALQPSQQAREAAPRPGLGDARLRDRCVRS